MIYKFAERSNYEDFAAGHVIYHRPGFTNYPVRLASEIFMRAYTHCGKKKVTLYDPCCGGGYLLTVLGFLHGDKINAIYGSDISKEAVSLTIQNMQLLSPEALLSRSYGIFEKEVSAQRLLPLCQSIKFEIFERDILSQGGNSPADIDIVITDVPYGDMTSWELDATAKTFTLTEGRCDRVGSVLTNRQGNMFPPLRMDAESNADIGLMLKNLNAKIIAVSSNKKQKLAIKDESYRRLEKFKVGKRKIEILRKNCQQ